MGLSPRGATTARAGPLTSRGQLGAGRTCRRRLCFARAVCGRGRRSLGVMLGAVALGGRPQEGALGGRLVPLPWWDTLCRIFRRESARRPWRGASQTGVRGPSPWRATAAPRKPRGAPACRRPKGLRALPRGPHQTSSPRWGARAAASPAPPWAAVGARATGAPWALTSCSRTCPTPGPRQAPSPLGGTSSS